MAWEEIQEKLSQILNLRALTLRLHPGGASHSTLVKNEIFPRIQVPSGTIFFIRLKGKRIQARSEKLYEFPIQQGVNLTETPTWPTSGIVIRRQPYRKRCGDAETRRWRKKENRFLLRPSSGEEDLIQRIIDCAKLN